MLYYIQSKLPEHERKIVVLVHGLLCSHRPLYFLGNYLSSQGYDIYLYRYPSTRYSIAEHGEQFRHYIQKLLKENPGNEISFVTHSLGGIVTREALCALSDEALSQCKHLIMLAPPTKGSMFAKLCLTCIPFASKWIKPLSELSCSIDAYVHQVAVPDKISTGVIAGRFDLTTPPSVTHIQGQKDFILLNATHTLILYHPDTKKAIANFLMRGNF